MVCGTRMPLYFILFFISKFYPGPIYRFYSVPVFRSTQHTICYKFLYIFLSMGNDEMMMIEYFSALFYNRPVEQFRVGPGSIKVVTQKLD